MTKHRLVLITFTLIRKGGVSVEQMNIFEFIPEPAQEPAKDSVVETQDEMQEESGCYQMTIWDYLIPHYPCPLGI